MRTFLVACTLVAVSTVMAACGWEETRAPVTSSQAISITPVTSTASAGEAAGVAAASGDSESAPGQLTIDPAYCRDLIVVEAADAHVQERVCTRELAQAIADLDAAAIDANRDGKANIWELIETFDWPTMFMAQRGFPVSVPETPRYEGFHMHGWFADPAECEAARMEKGGRSRPCQRSQNDQYYFEWWGP